MAKRLQHRGGTTSQHSSFTGAVREVTVDTDKDTLVVHDGATAGGKPLPTLTGTETLTNKTLTSATFSGTATNFTSTGIDDNATSTAITINSSEQVGIGTSSPDVLLSLEKNNAPRIQYKDTSGGTDAKVWRTMGLDSDYRLETRSDNLSNGQLAYVTTRSGYVVNEHKFYTTDSERLRITNTGLVGIGTSSPTHNLTVDGGTNTSISLIKDATGAATVRYYDGGSQKAYIQLTNGENMEFYAAANVDQIFYSRNSERMRLASGVIFNEGSLDADFRVESNNNANMLFVDGGNDKVGIGTGSPGVTLDVNSSTQTTLLHLNSTAGTSSAITFANTGSNDSIAISSESDDLKLRTDDGNILFAVAENTETMRITSVGKVQFKRARSNTLGQSCISIEPSDTTVGYGFRLEQTNNDLVVEKSAPSGSELEIARFKVGGGIALGGTGTANTLDDYEEGTFTPVFLGGVSGSGYARQVGRYTKIGNKVFFEFDIEGNGGLGSTTAQMVIGGLPFLSNSSAPYGGGVINYTNGIYTSEQLLFHIGGNDQRMYLYQLTGSNFLGTEAVNVNKRMLVHGHYTTA